MHLKRFFFLFLISILFSLVVSAQDSKGKLSIHLVLFTGKIFLLNQNQERIPAVVGQEFAVEDYPKIEVTPGSRLFLESGQKMVELASTGVFQIEELIKERSSLLQNALAFLQQLSQPRSFIQQSRARGSKGQGVVGEEEQKDLEKPEKVFEALWRKVVQGGEKEESQLSSQELLAAAAWYEQQGNSPRVAYLIEQLNLKTSSQNEFYQRLRNDSLQRVSLSKINDEVKQTKQEIASSMPPIHYQALLIGIDEYDDPSWQKLDNPIRDVRSIQETLVQKYGFPQKDIVLLENPRFDQIIGSLNQLKQDAGENTHLLVYYAGHGYYPPDEEEGYWIPKDAGAPSTQRLFIPTSTVLSKLKAIHSRHTLLIADSCFSGSLIQKTRGEELPSRFYQDLSQKKSRQVITSGGLEPVMDQGGGNHSLFAGKFLKALSRQDPNQPLSASELALILRKDVKNSGAKQTPEYGRLQLNEDESGEFFFVHKDFNGSSFKGKPLSTEKSSKESSLAEESSSLLNKSSSFYDNSEGEKEGEEVEAGEEDEFDLGPEMLFQMKGIDLWTSFGILYYNTNFQYNQPVKQSSGEVKNQANYSDLKGIGMRGKHRVSRDKLGFGGYLDLGQLLTLKLCVVESGQDSSQHCREEDNESQFDWRETSISGQFLRTGAFVDYTVYRFSEFNIQVGAEFDLQYLTLAELFEENQLDSLTLEACFSLGGAYRNGKWFIRPFANACLMTFELGGSLHKLDNQDANEIRLLANQSIGVMSGIQF